MASAGYLNSWKIIKIFQNLETPLYFLLWIAAVFYSIYQVYLINIYFDDYNDIYDDFKPGWKLINRKIDVSDEEWRIWIPFMRNLSLWVFPHVFVTQIIKKYSQNSPTYLCIWYIGISVIFLWFRFGFLSMLCTLLLPCISFLLASLKSKALSWIVHLSTLVIIYWAKLSDKIFMDWLMLKHEEYFMLTTAICWIQIRSISYSLDNIQNYVHINLRGLFQNLLQNVAYCLYLPTLFFGPVILYEQFVQGINSLYHQWNLNKLGIILFNLARYIFWIVFTEFTLHFLYFNALSYHPTVVSGLNSWAFYGFGYCMGQYFLNKYVAIYGLASTICKAEDIDAPAHPKCIGRIHLYSDMWKYFDRGLYKFLLKYIYIPYSPKSIFEKLKASALCFSFVFLWHGMQLFIFIWAFLNFLGIVVEHVAKYLGKLLYKYLDGYLSAKNKQRFECIISSPLLAISAISNFYFFGGLEIGNLFIQRFCGDPLEIRLSLLFALYCCCQVSTSIKKWEVQKLTGTIIKDVKVK